MEFGLKNLRRLKCVEPIELRSINVLVGRNSIGKSTFLRAIPLLRQSLNTRTSSPILWYGEDVDFGSFEGSVYENDTNRQIGFSFGLDRISTEEGMQYIDSGRIVQSKSITVTNLMLTVEISSSAESTYISNIRIKLRDLGDEIKISALENGNIESFFVNDASVLSLFSHCTINIISGSILPHLSVIAKKGGGGVEGSRIPYFLIGGDILWEQYGRLIASLGRKNQRKEYIQKLASKISSAWPLTITTLAEIFKESDQRSWEKFGVEMAEGLHDDVFQKFKQISISGKMLRIINSASDAVRDLVGQVMYIGPARARSERYYRLQDLAVSQIDAGGQNFSMFLNSLPSAQLDTLSRWVAGLFGYGLEVKRTPGHISIELVTARTRTNVVDTGYGVSQILPVLGQIWWAYNRPQPARRRGSGPQILAIEQPELHLHPAHQALLANAIVGARLLEPNRPRGAARRQVRYLIETHSETFVNRLGELISKKEIPADEVQILIFEEDKSDSSATSVTVAHFGQEGTLINWPYGFFQPAP